MTSPKGSKPLEQRLKRLQQELRQVQAAHRTEAEDRQRPAADHSEATARLCRSSAELLNEVCDSTVPVACVSSSLQRIILQRKASL